MELLSNKTTGSNLAANEWNQVSNELENIITQTGQTLNSGDLNQLGKGMANYVANSNFYTDSGSANSHVLTSIASNQSIVNYVDGMAVEFLAATNNTGPTTINVASKGIKDVVGFSGGPLVGGEITAGTRIVLKYRESAGDFIIDNLIAASVFAGAVVMNPTNTIPTGYLECDGSALNTGTFSDLFDVIGFDYGMSGSDFNLPDLRGEFIRGYNNSSGANPDPDAASRTDRGDGTTGDNVGTKQADDLDSHFHNVTAWGMGSFDNTGGPNVVGANSTGGGASGLTPEWDDDAIANTGGNETRSRNVYMMYIIKF